MNAVLINESFADADEEPDLYVAIPTFVYILLCFSPLDIHTSEEH